MHKPRAGCFRGPYVSVEASVLASGFVIIGLVASLCIAWLHSKQRKSCIGNRLSTRFPCRSRFSPRTAEALAFTGVLCASHPPPHPAASPHVPACGVRPGASCCRAAVGACCFVLSSRSAEMAVKEGFENSPLPDGPQAQGALVHWGSVKPDAPVTDKLEALQPHKGRRPLHSSRL